MDIIFLIIISLLPILALLWYFEKQDKGRKEPLRLKWKVFKWGLLAAILAGGIEVNLIWLLDKTITNFWLHIAINAFIIAAVTEEALKLWVVKKQIYKDKHFDEVMDGISYAIIASLGLAAIENILYVTSAGFEIGLIRAVISVPAHALFSGVMGYYIGLAKTAPTPWEGRSLLWKGFGFAVLYHGLFNFILLTQSELVLFIIPLLIVMGVHLKTLINRAHFKDKVINKKPKKLTAWRVIKIVLATTLIVLGVSSFFGSMYLVQDSAYDYTQGDILYSGIFAICLFVISWWLIRKRK